MEILSFDIIGKFAHFRKFYSNSTALSFTLPPRTTIIGILAGMLGREKESYYEEFSSDKIRVAASIQSSIKKQIHRINYLKVEDPKDFRGKKLHVQTPFEIVSPKIIRKEPLVYRIYLSYYEGGKSLFDEIHEKIKGKNFTYSLALGTAFFLANVKNVKFYSPDEIFEKMANNENINFNSAVNSEKAVELSFDRNIVKDFFIEEEQMPADFKGNYDRETVKMNKLLYIDGGRPLSVIFSGKYYELNCNKEKVNIDFWD